MCLSLLFSCCEGYWMQIPYRFKCCKQAGQVHSFFFFLLPLTHTLTHTIHAWQTENMPLQAILYVHIYTPFIPEAVIGSEGTIYHHTVAEQGCRHWFSSGVGWSLRSATAEIHWEHIGSDKVLWIHPTISYWVRSNFSELIHCRSTLTAAEQMTTGKPANSP